MAEAAALSTTYMSSPLIPIDLTKSHKDQVLPLHNRQHCGHSQCLLYTASTDGELHFRYSALSHWPYQHAARCSGQYDVKRPEISCLLEPIAMRSHVQTEGLLCLCMSFSVPPVGPLSSVAACKKQGILWPARCVRLWRRVSTQRQGSFSPLGRYAVVLSGAQNPGSSNV
jgi:hypothetical protein